MLEKKLINMKNLLVILLLSTSVFSQGPVDGYMKNKKDFSIGVSISREKAGKLYAGKNYIDTATGLDYINSGRKTYAFSIFAIYGITDKLNLQLNVPYLNVNSKAETDFQDASIYLKYSLLEKDNSKGNLRLMLATGFAMPLSDYQTAGGSAIGQMAFSGDGRLILQQNFNNKIFASIQGGYFLKSNPTPNAMSTSLKVGYAGKFYADAWFEIVHAFGGTDYRGTGELAPTGARGGFRGLGFSNQKVGATLFYPFTKHFGAFTGFSYVLNGRNAFKNTGLNIGIVFQ